jgi:hypothetical protein
MTEEQLTILRRKINVLHNMAYSSGCADEHPQQSYKQQEKYSQLAGKARAELYDFVIECLSTSMSKG